ncbi:Citrinin biosynthesis transcriptional activator ctnR [Colletotrichum trifolii]|uniref:Citrinin biosynthesis transcriptional activator ctnR n=1 Tax=Colletotrichum trifolii TaxID=5466 RepID=A0A4R8RNK9_COLTR|nr:Citrinin biosynthesis transcriptional activator ctnR [Colletotrichum trifolii]
MEPDGEVQSELTGTAGQGSEPLACVTCRSRKLKCDRVTPACGRCVKVKGECVYPESRRKPAFKRRNVKELEERLAQVEDLLREAKKPSSESVSGSGDLDSRVNVGMDDFTVDVDTFLSMQNGLLVESVDIPSGMSLGQNGPHPPPLQELGFDDPGELIGLGLSEALPPFEMMEELNKAFFERQSHFIPIIHPGRYFQSFYSAPHKRPPMCLQYAVWSMASNGHEKFHQYHDIFYKRARQYADADEMRSYGEHFLTVQHAQAWALIATDEARCMFFTRAAMSSAKCVRLVEMMGLHRIDGDGQEMAPTLAPPTSWVDLEERRRAFWGAYCIDCHASISTGWPTLIDPNDISTHLPSSEDAFTSGREEKTSTMQEAFKGASYSTFAGAVVICYVFNLLLKHVHQERPNDRPEDVEYGEFWRRHRDIDNMLSSAFLFLPERFRLPQSMREPTAVHTNLNLHASIICLHHAAVDRIEKHKLPEQLRAVSHLRLRTAAEEVVNIVKMTSHMNSGYRSPLVALSLYSAASVYVYNAKCDPQHGISMADLQNLKFIIQAMEGIGRKHLITQAFLQQIYMDIDRNGLSGVIDVPNLNNYKNTFGWTCSNIPLLARSSISKHTEIQPPLPGRLPLGNPKGTAYEASNSGCNTTADTARSACPTEGLGLRSQAEAYRTTDETTYDNGPNKRKRTSMAATVAVEGMVQNDASLPQFNLPHRTSSASASPSSVFNKDTPGQSAASSTTTPPGVGTASASPDDISNGAKADDTREIIDITSVQNAGADGAASTWDSRGLQYAPSTDPSSFIDFESVGGIDPWSMLTDMGDMSWTNGGRGEAATGSLEQLEKEVQTIKNAVNPSPVSAARGLPPPGLPLPLPLTLPSPSTAYSTSAFSDRPPPSAGRVSLPALSPVLSHSSSRPAEQVPTPSLTSHTTPTGPPRSPAQPRALGSKVLSSEDIDIYFDRYFEYFHHYFPIVRSQDPDKLYRLSPVLFWAIIAVASRRYAKDSTLFSFLIENLPKEVWSAVANPPLSISTINALLLLCTWPLPSLRFLTDPSSSYVAIAQNAALALGFHTGRGTHPEFCIGPNRQTDITDEEACFTWMGYNIQAQRVASSNGVPPPAGFFNDAVNRAAGGRSLPDALGYFGLLYEMQKFSNRLNRTMFSVAEEGEGIGDSVIQLLEDELNKLRQLQARHSSDLDLFTILAVQFELQSYHFVPLSTADKSTFRQNANRAYSTAQALINLSLRLEASHRFLHHAPQHVFRTVLDASTVIFDMLQSAHATDLELANAEVSVKNAQEALRRCSVQDGDFAMRVLRMTESYWSLRHIMAPLEAPISNYPHRTGAVLAFGTLRRWKKELDQARMGQSGTGAGVGAGAGAAAASGGTASMPATDVSTAPGGAVAAGDPLQDIDWSMLMDDFDWSAGGGGEPNFLGLS